MVSYECMDEPRPWWMSYMVDGEQIWESARSSPRPVAARIWKARESEIALGKFKVGCPGKRIKFEELCDEFERSHFAGISENTIKGYRAYLKHLRAFFVGLVLTNITARLVCPKAADNRVSAAGLYRSPKPAADWLLSVVVGRAPPETGRGIVWPGRARQGIRATCEILPSF